MCIFITQYRKHYLFVHKNSISRLLIFIYRASIYYYEDFSESRLCEIILINVKFTDTKPHRKKKMTKAILNSLNVVEILTKT